ncbi:MAG: hypothetical protein COA79_12920 [Planctomycetota bacterium]|nr:MAG: hypothetical protein COA79_12920 [Planctomycetota bacterium]
MNILELIKIGIEGLLVHKVRSMLSILGIIFGVASVAAVLSIVGGARKEVLRKMEALGTNNIIISKKDWEEKVDRQKELRRITSGLSLRDAEDLKNKIKGLDVVAPYTLARANILINDNPMQVNTYGVTGDYKKTLNFNLKEGRFISEFDNFSHSKVCVIEENLIKKLKDKISINEFISIDHDYYLIVGIIKSKDFGDDNSEIKDLQSNNQKVYIPLETSLRFISRSFLDPEIDGITLKVKNVPDLKKISLEADQILKKNHHLKEDSKEKDFNILIAVDLVKNFESTQNIFNWVLGCSAGISLLVGGIGIMNIMLANVSERKREIGVRLSIGATQKDILFQFVFESAGLGVLGGFLGLILGILLTEIIKMQSGMPTYFSYWGAALAIFISVFDACIFGTYPAWKASKLDPVEALNDD